MEDTELVSAAEQGNLDAFNELVLKYQNQVFDHASRLLGNHDVAEDIIQGAFVLAFRKIQQYRGDSFRAWLLKIVTNLSYSEMRTWKREPLHGLESVDRDGETNESPDWMKDQNLAGDYLGFAWRHIPFARLRDNVNLKDIWILWEKEVVVGYVFAREENSMLLISLQLLRMDVNATEAVAAVVSELKTPYVQISVSRPCDIEAVRRAGWQVAHLDWGAFMIKPLAPDVTIEDARRLFGIGTDRSLISWLDTT